jgi:hypothetical protein
MPESLTNEAALARARQKRAPLSNDQALARARGAAPQSPTFFAGETGELPAGTPAPQSSGPAFTAGSPETDPRTSFSPDAQAPYVGRNASGEPMFSSSGEPAPNVSQDRPEFSIGKNVADTVASTTVDPFVELFHTGHPDQPQTGAGVATRGLRMASSSFLPFTAPLGVASGVREAAKEAGVEETLAEKVMLSPADAIEAPFKAIDEYISEPISEMFKDPEMKELVREGGNLIGAILFGKMAHSAYGRGKAAARTRYRGPDLPNTSALAAETARTAQYKGKVSIGERAKGQAPEMKVQPRAAKPADLPVPPVEQVPGVGGMGTGPTAFAGATVGGKFRPVYDSRGTVNPAPVPRAPAPVRPAQADGPMRVAARPDPYAPVAVTRPQPGPDQTPLGPPKRPTIDAPGVGRMFNDTPAEPGKVSLGEKGGKSKRFEPIDIGPTGGPPKPGIDVKSSPEAPLSAKLEADIAAAVEHFPDIPAAEVRRLVIEAEARRTGGAEPIPDFTNIDIHHGSKVEGMDVSRLDPGAANPVNTVISGGSEHRATYFTPNRAIAEGYGKTTVTTRLRPGSKVISLEEARSRYGHLKGGATDAALADGVDAIAHRKPMGGSWKKGAQEPTMEWEVAVINPEALVRPPRPVIDPAPVGGVRLPLPKTAEAARTQAQRGMRTFNEDAGIPWDAKGETRTPLEVAEASGRERYRKPAPPETPGKVGLGDMVADATPVPTAKGGRFNRNIESFRKPYGQEGTELSDSLGKWQAQSRVYQGRVTTGADTEFRRIVSPKHRDIAAKNIGNWIENRGEVPEWGQKFYRAVLEGVRRNAENTIDANLMIQDNSRGWRQMNPDAEVFTHRIEYDRMKRLREQSVEGYQGPTPDLDRWMAEGKNSSKPNPFASEALDPTAAPGRTLEGGPGTYAGAEKARIYDIPLEFMPEDQFATLRSHWRRTSQVAAENKVFNQTKQNPRTGQWTRDAGDLGRIYDRIGQRMGKGDAKTAKERVDRIMERLDSDNLTETAKSVNRAASLWTMATKLGGSVTQILQQSSQLGTQAVVNPGATAVGTGRVIRLAATETAGNVRTALRDGQGIREITRAIADGLTEPARRAREAGAMQPDAYTKSLDLADPHGGSKPMRMARRVTDAAQTAQMTLDSISRAIAYEAAPTHIRAVQEALAKGGRKAEWAQQQMVDLDLPTSVRQAITRGEMTPAIENHFRQRWTAYLNVESGVAEFPRILGESGSDPRFMVARQLAGFQMGQTRAAYEQIVKPTFKGRVAPALRYAVIGTVIGELIEQGNENVPLIGKERKQDRKSWDEIASSLESGDSGPLMRRIGQNIGRSGMAGYGDVLVDLASSEPGDERREIEFTLKRLLPPIISDAVVGVSGIVGGLFDPTAEDKVKRSAKEGRVDLHLDMKERDRLDVILREAGTTLRKVAPQINRIQDQLRARFSEDYRNEQIRKTLKNDMTPSKGRENRLKHLIDLGQK